MEVAKVFTLIDPRKQLPEAVNVEFDSGEIARVLVSSPWMPPVCSICKEIIHKEKRCQAAPKSCKRCNSTGHSSDKCDTDTTKLPEHTGRKTRRGCFKPKGQGLVWAGKDSQSLGPPQVSTLQAVAIDKSKLGSSQDFDKGETSGHALVKAQKPVVLSSFDVRSNTTSEAEMDSSDVFSGGEEDEGEITDSARKSSRQPVMRNSGTKGTRGRGPNL